MTIPKSSCWADCVLPGAMSAAGDSPPENPLPSPPPSRLVTTPPRQPLLPRGEFAGSPLGSCSQKESCREPQATLSRELCGPLTSLSDIAIHWRAFLAFTLREMQGSESRAMFNPGELARSRCIAYIQPVFQPFPLNWSYPIDLITRF
jgi:hypothetical protein